MKKLEIALNKYLECCRAIFEESRSELAKIVPFRGYFDSSREMRPFFERAIANAEHTAEFDNFVEILANEVLTEDLATLKKEWQRREKRQEKKRRKLAALKKDMETETNKGKEIKPKVRRKKIKPLTLDEKLNRRARSAAQHFFRNSGAYLHLFEETDLDRSALSQILKNYSGEDESESLRLFVFNSFELYDNGQRLKKIILPIGELNNYTEEELIKFFRLPQSTFHHDIDPETIKKISERHVLTIKSEGLRSHTTPDWHAVGGYLDESDTNLLGPMFLWHGEWLSIAEEIRISTNIFRSPLTRRYTIDDYEGRHSSKLYPMQVGANGDILINIYEAWHTANRLLDGMLTFPTASFGRAVMTFVRSGELYFEAIVNLVATMESILVPYGRAELNYKTAIRAAALLEAHHEDRFFAFEYIRELYKTRSKIVHTGHYKGSKVPGIGALYDIPRLVILRFAALISLAHDAKLGEWIISEPKLLESNNKRGNAIAHLLDAVVMDANITLIIEEELRRWGLGDSDIEVNWGDR